MRRHLLMVFVLSAASFAVTATQTDWSGGSGVLGPVTDWSNTYYTGNQIDHTGNSLLLTSGILGTPVEHQWVVLLMAHGRSMLQILTAMEILM